MYTLWGNFLFLGEALSVLLGQFIINYMFLDWKIYIIAFSSLFLIFNFLFYFYSKIKRKYIKIVTKILFNMSLEVATFYF